jgi:hypothetical protein
MTFKHTKFEDSVTMRSLEKLATEKGLIKNDPLKKIAEKKAKTDLKPTGNLTENIMKLCAGLREAGFAKYAEELESTYIMYKKAATECDNDILQQAHPKGSYKLEGVEGDATIETIIDQHLANMKMVNKKPTGKLTNANAIINAVKISLADDVETESSPAFQQEAKKYIKYACNELITGIKLMSESVGNHTIFIYNIENKELKKWLEFSNTGPDIIMDINRFNSFAGDIRSIKNIRNMIKPDLGNNRFVLSGDHLLSFMSSRQYDFKTAEDKQKFKKGLSLVDSGIRYADLVESILIDKNLDVVRRSSFNLPAADVVRELNNHLINPLMGLQLKLHNIDYEGKKDKLSPETRAAFDSHFSEMNTVIRDARSLIYSYTRGEGTQLIDLRAINDSIVAINPESQLKTVFSGSNNLQDIINKSIAAANTYRISVDNAEQWLNNIK